jgi:solute carrier family 25 (adenine nucleotide translocator) protein 4/5/6/31
MSNIKKESNFVYDFILAGIAAAIGKTATAPLERVKLLLQNQYSIKVIEKPYTGIIDCTKRLIKAEGFLSLWRGNVANVIRYFPNQAMNFALKDTIKKEFRTYDPKAQFWKFAAANCMAGGIASSISLIFCHPIDLVRTRLALDNKNKTGERKFSGSIDCLSKIYKAEGFNGVYKGMVISVVGIFAFRAVYFGFYDTLKGLVIKKDTNFFIKWALAQSITVFSSAMFYPLDTLRRRMMLQSGETVPIYKNSIDCAIKMMKEEKILGFYKGWGTNAIKMCGSSIILVLYDEFQKVLGLEARGGLKE